VLGNVYTVTIDNTCMYLGEFCVVSCTLYCSWMFSAVGRSVQYDCECFLYMWPRLPSLQFIGSGF